MKERPILMNTEMVLATLDGRKTQTRRAINAPVLHDQRAADRISHKDDIWAFDWSGDDICGGFEIKCPYGQVGDKLWVRETFCIGAICEEDTPEVANGALYIDQCALDTDFIPKEYAIRNNINTDEVKWKPSIHMPKQYSRIHLEITSIRVEQNSERVWEWVVEFKRIRKQRADSR